LTVAALLGAGVVGLYGTSSSQAQASPPLCHGVPATIWSTSTAIPVLYGTTGDDVIVGSRANETILGDNGDDLYGDDLLKAGTGNDTYSQC
jgi:Ca2+-binding RTX toxin-like protein